MKRKELLCANLHGLKKFEIKRRLRSERDVAIAGKSGAAGTRSSPNESADSRTLATTRESADCCASGCAAANHRSGALAFADRKSTRLNSSHVATSYAVFCLKKKTRE